MSDGKSFSLVRLALFFTAAAGVAVGAKILLDSEKGRKEALPKPERQSAVIIPFRPSR